MKIGVGSKRIEIIGEADFDVLRGDVILVNQAKLEFLLWIRIFPFFDIGTSNEKPTIDLYNNRTHLSLYIDHFPHHLRKLGVYAHSIIEKNRPTRVRDLVASLHEF